MTRVKTSLQSSRLSHKIKTNLNNMYCKTKQPFQSSVPTDYKWIYYKKISHTSAGINESTSITDLKTIFEETIFSGKSQLLVTE